jgi:Mn2+/Fe2+ NRAMP family transporter
VTAKRIKVADVPLRRKAATKLRKAALFKQLGPGLVTGAADDDPSGIAT